MNRNRRKDEIEKAYEVQVAAGLRGAAQFGAAGGGAAVLAHHYWPAFRYVFRSMQLDPIVIEHVPIHSAPLAHTGGKRYHSKPGLSQYVEPLSHPSLLTSILMHTLTASHPNLHPSCYIWPCHLRGERAASPRARRTTEGEQRPAGGASRPCAPRACCDRDGNREVEGGARACQRGGSGGSRAGGHQGAGVRVRAVACIVIGNSTTLSLRYASTSRHDTWSFLRNI